MFSELSYLPYSVYVVSLRLWKPHFRVHDASRPHVIKKTCMNGVNISISDKYSVDERPYPGLIQNYPK